MHNLIEHAKPLTIYLITWNNNNEKQILHIYRCIVLYREIQNAQWQRNWSGVMHIVVRATSNFFTYMHYSIRWITFEYIN